MAFTAKDVMELKDRTGAGMMECKKALTETDGDKDKAIALSANGASPRGRPRNPPR